MTADQHDAIHPLTGSAFVSRMSIAVGLQRGSFDGVQIIAGSKQMVSDPRRSGAFAGGLAPVAP